MAIDVAVTTPNADPVTVWTDYVLAFYGAGGIYDMGVTKDEVLAATETVYEKYGEDGWGGGDSLDRERVRDELIENYGKVFPND